MMMVNTSQVTIGATSRYGNNRLNNFPFPSASTSFHSRLRLKERRALDPAFPSELPRSLYGFFHLLRRMAADRGEDEPGFVHGFPDLSHLVGILVRTDLLDLGIHDVETFIPVRCDAPDAPFDRFVAPRVPGRPGDFQPSPGHVGPDFKRQLQMMAHACDLPRML